MDVVKRAAESIRRMWGQLTVTQKVFLFAAAALAALVLAWGSSAAGSEPMVRVAGHEVDDQARGEILKKLQEKNERYEVRGGEIYLPRETADRVVLELAGDGAMSGEAVWKFLENSDILAPEWQLKKRYQVALQRKLEIMIRRVEGVRNAGVVLSPGSESDRLGFRDGAKASASVQVELRSPSNFGPKQAKAIAGLVARAVPGLEADRVHVMDTRGIAYHIPRDNGNLAVSGDIRDLEARLEEDIKAKIEGLFTAPRVVVRVEANAKETKTEERTHGNRMLSEGEDHKRVEKAKPPAVGGIKGGNSLAPDAPSDAQKDATEQSSREKYVFDEKTMRVIAPAGEILKVTVGVLIPVLEGDKEPMSEEEAKRFVLAATGRQAGSSDVVVKFIPTKRPEVLPPAPSNEKASEWLGTGAGTIALVALAALALAFFLLRILGAATAKGAVEEIRAITAEVAQGAAAAPDPAVLTRADNVVHVKQSIQDVIGRNPAGAAEGLKQWVSGTP